MQVCCKHLPLDLRCLRGLRGLPTATTARDAPRFKLPPSSSSSPGVGSESAAAQEAEADLSLCPAGDKWRRRRKLLTPSFHSRVLEEFLPPLYREAGILADKLATHCGAAAFDVVPYAKLAALDVICCEVPAQTRYRL